MSIFSITRVSSPSSPAWRRTARGDARGQHDDLANSVAGAFVSIGSAKPDMKISDAVYQQCLKHEQLKRSYLSRGLNWEWYERCRESHWRNARLS